MDNQVHTIPVDPPVSFDDRPSPEAVKQIRDFIGLFVKTVHTLLLYPPSNPLPGQFREQFFKAAQAVLREHPSLLLATTDRGFRFHGETVYDAEPSDTNPAYALFRDGVREIGLVSTLTPEEANAFLDAFVGALSRTAASIDIGNTLWELGLQSIYYCTVDQVEDGELGYQLDSSAYQRASRLFFSTVDLGPPNVTEPSTEEAANPHGYQGIQRDRYLHIRNVFHGEIAIGTEEAREVMDMLAGDAECDCVAEAFRIYDEILHSEAGARMMDEVLEVTKRQFDTMVEQDSWPSVPGVLRNVREWLADFADQPLIAEALRKVLHHAGETTVIDRMAAYLNLHPQCDLGPFREILVSLDTTSLGAVTAMLGDLQHHAARKMVYSFLGEHATEALDSVGNYVYDKRWFVVRNVALILGRVNRPRAVTFLKKAAAHSDMRVRLEAVRSLGALRCPEADEVLLPLVDDSNFTLRIHALKAIAGGQSQSVFETLEKRVQDPRLAQLEPRMQKELLAAYARAGGVRALPFLLSLISRKRFFGKSRWDKMKLYAIYALGEVGSASALDVLREVAKSADAALSTAATQVLERPQRPAELEPSAPAETES